MENVWLKMKKNFGLLNVILLKKLRLKRRDGEMYLENNRDQTRAKCETASLINKPTKMTKEFDFFYH